MRSEWSRLKGKGLPSIWAPASQVSSHVGNAGVGVVSLRGAPLVLPTFATAQFKSFFDCGRAVRCLLPLASGRFLHLFVLYGYQGADSDAEQLSLTDQLFDAALVLLLLVSPVYWLLISTWSPPKSLAWQKGFRLGCGLTLRKLGPLLLVCILLLPVSVVGLQLVVIVGILFLVVLLLLLLFFLAKFSRIGGLLLIWLSVLFLIMVGGSLGLRSLFIVPLFGLLLGCLLLTSLWVLSLLMFTGFGRFMMIGFSLFLVGTLLYLMSPLVEMIFLLLGLSGLGLLSLHSLMRFSSVVVHFPLEVWFLAGCCFVS